MHQILCSEWGGPERLTLVEAAPPPPPAPGMVTVTCQAWGLNFVDLLMVAGGYQLKPPLPFVPGLEAAGTISAVGTGVTGWREGDPVITAHRPGAFAEQVSVPVAALSALPAGYQFAEGACFRSAFHTAYHGLVQGGRLQAGEVVVIHGAAGGMGHAAVQVAKRLGAIVIATANGAEKCAKVMSLGSDHCLDAATEEWRHQAKALSGGRGVDVVFDPVGGRMFDESMRCLNYGARLVVVGFTDGRPALARTNHILIKSASVIGIRAGEFARRHPAAAANNAKVLHRWAEAGAIRPHISHQFDFADYQAAMQVIAARQAIGRVALVRSQSS